MKLIGHDGARAIQMISPEELRPLNGAEVSFPAFLSMLQERYNFQVMPNLQTDPPFLVLKGGTISDGKKNFFIKEVQSHPTFLLVDCIQTEGCDLFLADLLDWGAKALRWRPISNQQPRKYFCASVVEFDVAIESKVKMFESLCALFAKSLHTQYGVDYPHFLKSLAFAVDPLKLPPNFIQSEILIQRRADYPYENNARFYVTGPFKTSDIEPLFGEVEKILLG